MHAALADRVVTPAEWRDLTQVAHVLGFDEPALRQLVDRARSGAPGALVRARPERSESLVGKTVCFTGTMNGRLNSELINREAAETLARRAGLIVLNGVTRKLDVLVVADPHALLSKARKARQYGTRIIAEPAFWRATSVDVQ